MNSSNAQRLAARRLPLLPPRVRTSNGPRTGFTPTGSVTLQIGDAFWKCGVEVAKIVYSRIDARYPIYLREADDTASSAHSQKMTDARKILNEHRNEVLEAVLPLFHVRLRTDGESVDEADVHAHDYIVRNQFDMMVKTFKAWADQFVESGEVEALERTIDKVAAVQRERLAGLLLNFRFDFIDLSVKPREKNR